VTVPEKAPQWLVDVVPWLLEHELGCHFTSLVVSLVRLETAFAFDDGNGARVPNQHRPDEVTKWISGGRLSKTRKIPHIKNLEKYAKAFFMWWDSLQPKWRSRGRDNEWKFGGDVEYGPADAWGELDVPGQNGCLTLVAALYIWG
ncbi:hypothetical protein C8R43DRAFT_844169, partial [Mycena crocata]